MMIYVVKMLQKSGLNNNNKKKKTHNDVQTQ